MAPIPAQTRQWILTNRPDDLPTIEGPEPTFSLQTRPLPTSLSPSQVLVKPLFLSNDPAMRAWIKKGDPERLYTEPVPVGAPMRAGGIAEIIAVGSGVGQEKPELKQGDHVRALTGWSEYVVMETRTCTPLALPLPKDLPETAFLGALGITGLTAYVGLMDVVNVTKEDAVVVSGAAGATGSMVVQVAKKLVGCKKVVGMASSADKCRWVESIGADVCLNYKDMDFVEKLKGATDGFVEVYFDNVGGEILDLMLTRVKRHGRIAACGAISNYNKNSEAQYGIKNWFEIIMNRIMVKGFVVPDHMHRAPEVMQTLRKALEEGKLTLDASSETVVDTKFEDIPQTWLRLFEGSNSGKLITKIV